ncbi:MAG TPA: flagellar hook-basal body complex protein FliE [Syntrophales bacterium]|nr:flagellar hook-basal body complex protein FliE [Syntrophales bacterium]HPX10759.1 flagellar hook-basal body complex protein FliE [Syntrophales bacterium]HQB30205.1 flagellar hook-basal body complex protein FliE [Syntrophales bacterium]HQN77645.1 flagellar hook-basal body complex protein FliE [Syntrophales bacterium]HQQ26603.1 flagellar hook-basal body complex protein FliE [Syntrophales bacterium]
MSDFIVRNDLIPPGLTPAKSGESGKKEEGQFQNVLKGMIQEIGKLQDDADKAIETVQFQNTGSIHEAMIALEKADVSFKVMMQVRNKILEAYQEIMRMQI